MNLGLEYIRNTEVVDMNNSMIDYVLTSENYFESIKDITKELSDNLVRYQNLISVKEVIHKYQATESICALVGDVSEESIKTAVDSVIEWFKKRIDDLKALFNKIVEFFSKKDKEQEQAANQAIEESKKEEAANPQTATETIKLSNYLSNLDRGFRIMFNKVGLPFSGKTDAEIIELAKQPRPTPAELIKEKLMPGEGNLSKGDIYKYIQLCNSVTKEVTNEIKLCDNDIRDYTREMNNLGVEEEHIAALKARIENTQYKLTVLKMVKTAINTSRAEATAKIQIKKPRATE